MTKRDLLKEIKDRIFEAEVTLQFFIEKEKAEVLIEQQKEAIEELKSFCEFLKK